MKMKQQVTIFVLIMAVILTFESEPVLYAQADSTEAEITADVTYDAAIGTIYSKENGKGKLQAYFGSSDKLTVTYHNKKKSARYVYIYIYRDGKKIEEYGHSVASQKKCTDVFTTNPDHNYKIEAYQYDGASGSSSCIDSLTMTF